MFAFCAGGFEGSEVDVEAAEDGLGDEFADWFEVAFVGFGEDAVVAFAVVFEDDAERIAGFEDEDVHDEAGGAAVAVPKWVNVGEFVME